MSSEETGSISPTDLVRVKAGKSQDDFSFLVGDECYGCPSAVAELLSPKITQFRMSDFALTEFRIESPDPLSWFGQVLSLGRGSPINVDESNRRFFLSVFHELSNSDLYFSILDVFEGGPTFSNVIDRLRLHDEFGSLGSKELSFIASNFSTVPSSVLNSLTLPQLYEILSLSSLRISDEDSLYAFIISGSESDISRLSLFDFIRFDALEASNACDFSRRLECEFEYFTPWTLQIVRHSLIDRENAASKELLAAQRKLRGEVFPFVAEHPLDGIFASLTRKYEGNPCDKGIVTITSSSIESNDPRYHPKNVVDASPSTHFGTRDDASSWICFDFKTQAVVLTHYTMVTYHDYGTWTAGFPRSWAVEISEDGLAWESLDVQTSCLLLDGPDRTATFLISNPAEARFVRIRMTGPHHRGRNHLELARVEFFGTLLN
jgi:hypothetical protein